MQNYLPSRATPIELSSWVVVEVPILGSMQCDRHVVGLADEHICISPPIRSFDAKRAIAHCATHRSLSLNAESAWTSETRKAWSSWKLLNNVCVDRDITFEFYTAMKTLKSEVIS